MKILESLGGNVKAAAARIIPERMTPFAATGGYGVSNGNGGPYLAGLHNARSPGSVKDWETKVGDPLDNRVVAACVMAKTRAHNAAPIVLKRRQGDDWKVVPSHPLLDLLNFPNDEYSADDLWAGNIGKQSC